MKEITIILTVWACSLARPVVAEDVKGGRYTLRITHVADHPAVTFPGGAIPEEAYKPAKDEEDLRLQFSEAGDEVVLLPEKIAGTLESEEGGRRVYRLRQGFFAGGELVIHETDGGLVGTFTIYGSGVPVISSVRGGLTAVEE